MTVKTAVVTGGSSGIGAATAALFAARGWHVYELSRHGSDVAGVTHLSADVTDSDSLKAAFDAVIAAEGRLDLLVNNAGGGISGAVEFTDIADAQRLFDVNFFGAVRCVQAALPYLRKTKGRIVNLSSVAAPIAIPFQCFYSAGKAAINSLSMCLANELRPFGIKVSAVMPGDVRTGFTDARRKSTAGDDIYGSAISCAVSVMEHDERSGMPPQKVAAVIYKAALARRPKILYTAGGKYRLFVVIQKLLPATLCNRLVGAIYR